MTTALKTPRQRSKARPACRVGWCLFLSICVVSTTAVSGQSQPTWVPIDQAVADLDRLSTGLRHVETGLRLDGEHTSLFRLDPPPPNQDAFGSAFQTGTVPPGRSVYLRVGPGFQAQVDRIDYLIQTGRRSFRLNVQPLTDGRFIESVAANTVFVLSPVARRAQATTDPPIDHRIDGRIEHRIDARLNLDITGHTQAVGRTYNSPPVDRHHTRPPASPSVNEVTPVTVRPTPSRQSNEPHRLDPPPGPRPGQ